MAAAKVRREVKEIKQRQQNWLKQRDVAIKTDASKSPTQVVANTHSSKQHDKSLNLKQQVFHSKTATSKQKTPSIVEKINQDTRPKAKFHQWLSAKTEKDEKSVIGIDDVKTNSALNYTKSRAHATESENGCVKGSSPEHEPDTAMPKESWSSSSSREHSLLSADQFDSVADAIVKKVRDELNIKKNSKGATADYVPKTTGLNQKYDTSHTSQLSTRESTPVNTNNHSCPDCSDIMLAPDHCPMLVIPCGHNLCSKCVSQCDLCPTCDCEITGFTQNIMLQQIISRFHKVQNPQEDFSVDHIAQKELNRTTPAMQYNTSTEEIDYREEYHSLCLRCEVLQAESADIEDHIVSLDCQVERTNHQIGNIQEQQNHLQSQINELEEKIGSLEKHKDEYAAQRDVITKKIEKEKSKLRMVQETKKSLKAEAQKMKYLAGID